MTVQEYLSQGYRLEEYIASDMQRLEEARDFARSIPSPRADGNRVSSSLAGEAPFVRAVERANAMEEKIKAELDLLLALKEQMEHVISSVPGEELRLIDEFDVGHVGCEYGEYDESEEQKTTDTEES